MRTVCRRNREIIEDEYMALLINKPELLVRVREILPKYLFKKENQILYQQILECYEKYQLVNFDTMFTLHPDFNIDYLTELWTKELYYNTAWEQQLKLSKESIVRFYKEDIIKNLNSKFSDGSILYAEYISQMKKTG